MTEPIPNAQGLNKDTDTHISFLLLLTIGRPKLAKLQMTGGHYFSALLDRNLRIALVPLKSTFHEAEIPARGSTRAVHSGEDRHGQAAPLTTPIAQTAVFVVPGLEDLRATLRAIATSTFTPATAIRLLPQRRRSWPRWNGRMLPL